MNQIVIFEPDIKLNDLLVSIIDSCVRKFEVITFYEYQDVASYLEDEYENVKLLLFDYNTYGVDILLRFKSIEIAIPTILMTSLTINKIIDFSAFKDIHIDNTYVTKPIKEGILSQKIIDILKKEKGFDETLLQNFKLTSITPAILLYAESSPSDIYIDTGKQSYAVVIKKGDSIDDKKIQLFLEKGITKFYITRTEKESFYDYFLDIVEQIDYEFDAKNVGRDLAVQQQILTIVFDKLQQSGLDEKLLNSAKRTLENNIEMINNTKKLKKLLGGIIGKNENILEHSLTTNMIAQIVLKELRWDIQTSQLKISMAAFFHDILITEFDEGMEELESKASYDRESLKESNPIFFNHPLKAAELLDKMKNIPADVTQIISSHHELPNGKGFPKGLFGARTAPLSCLFNTVHYFCIHCNLRGWTKLSIAKTLKEMEESFYDRNYEKPYEALLKLFK